MKLAIPGLCFLTSSIPLEFNTDGHIMHFGPTDQTNVDTGQILAITTPHIQLFNLKSIPEISLFDSITLPDSFHVPEMYDGSQDLHGKNILIIMLNGWGDMILIQPTLRAFYEKGSLNGNSFRITVACNWIDNFPYPGVNYIHNVRSNIMTFKDLCSFDILVNLVPANYERSHKLSLRDTYLKIMKMEADRAGYDTPSLQPDRQRVEKIKHVLDDARKKTGKKLLCVNWRARFPHKNAPVHLFSKIVNALSHEYQAILFKDAGNSRIMQKEIDESNMSVLNFSFLIRDYHDTMAALSLMDAVVSVDTGIVHAAGAMRIPGVALFGPFPPETHVADYPSIMAVRAPYRGEYCQAPCLETHRGCAAVGYSQERVSPCFEAIELDYVMQAFDDAITHCRGLRKSQPTRNLSCVF